MAMRTPSLQNDSIVGINREVGSQFDTIKVVADNMDGLLTVVDTMSTTTIVADNVGIISTVSNSMPAITAVSDNLTNIGILNDSILEIDLVANNMPDINAVVTSIIPNLAQILEVDTNATTAIAMAVTATAQADLATAAKITAEIAQGIAETKASEASLSAIAADTSADLAIVESSTATTQAGIATAQAIIATTKAVEASASAITASAKADAAGIDADDASISAAASEASAVAAASSKAAAETQAALVNSAKIAAESAATAADLSKTAAANSAILAAEKLTLASGQSELAVLKAGEASGYATIATNKATEAIAARDTILSMDVATGAAGSSVAWDGATLTVPQGIQGIQGIQGVPGLKGDIGEGLTIKGTDTAANIAAIVGAAAGDFWIASDTGDGYTWTDTIWKNTGQIRGPQGVQGIQGETGSTGAQGAKGDTGETGLQGAQGIQGIKGDTGDVGPKGDIGDTGLQGIQGIQGIKGDAGDVTAQQLADGLATKAAAVHNHDGSYYTEGEIDTMLAGLDPLPTQTGNAGKYLTTSGTVASWAEVAGKQDTLVSGTSIKTVNGTSVLGSGDIVTPTTTLASVAPLIAGTAAVGVSTAVARQDHVHPAQTTITGNAATATKLAATKTISGVAFDGSANINIEDRLGTPIASAATTTVGTAGLGDYVHITGTTTITSLGTATTAGIRRTLIFDGALTLTHNATSLICTGGVNITTIAGTVIEVVAETTANWRVVSVTHPSVSIAELGYLDGVTSSVQTQLNGKLGTAGGTMTGAITAIRETKVAMGANAIDLSAGNLFTKTITTATTFTISNALTTGNANTFILELTNAGAWLITWFSGVKWAGGTAPTLTSSGVDILGFYSHDGGTTWRGMVLAKDSK